MADPSIFDAVRIPSDTLIALDWRPFQFAMQPFHYLVRMAHILSIAAFFGGVGLLDLRLLGVREALPLRSFAAHVLPWLYLAFGISVVSGLLLFFYNPLAAGSRAYWTPKLIAIALGLANAAIFHRTSYGAALTATGQVPISARVAGGTSLMFWTAAMVFACLNTETVPRVFLR